MKFNFCSLCPRVAGCVVTCSKNIKTVREMADDKDIPKVGKKYSNFGLPSVVGGSTSRSALISQSF